MVLLNRFRSSSHLSFGDFTLAEKQQSRQDLPPRDIAANRVTFDQYFAMQQSNIPPEHASWYASINLVLCIGSRCRANERHLAPEESTRAWGYFQHAMSVVPELIFRTPTTMSIQALNGMVCVVSFSPVFLRLGSLKLQIFRRSSRTRISHFRHLRCFFQWPSGSLWTNDSTANSWAIRYPQKSRRQENKYPGLSTSLTRPYVCGSVTRH